jgi:2-C-methyl-D-erythritol 4-phosphate cytidylyltransferase
MFRGKRVGVVIPAAGRSERMGGLLRKQFLEFSGKPMWLYTCGRFLQSSYVDHVVVAGPYDSLDEIRRVLSQEFPKKSVDVVAGGEQRQDSVWAGLVELKKHSPDIVLVHDAVRPLVSDFLIEAILDAVVEYRAAVPFVAPKDTIKIQDGRDLVKATPKRNMLVAVQTPQGFEAAILYEAFEKAQKEGFYGTDESSLVERLGVAVKLVRGDYRNIKITDPEDLALVKGIVVDTEGK